jgi:hypothetical protein
VSSSDELDVLSAADGRRWIYEHPARFFAAARCPRAGYSAERELTENLVGEPLACGAAAVEASRCEDWRVIWSDTYWLQEPLDHDALERVMRLPEAGQNSMRQEVLAAVFAANVVVSDGAALRAVKGASDAALVSHLASRPHARALALRFLDLGQDGP